MDSLGSGYKAWLARLVISAAGELPDRKVAHSIVEEFISELEVRSSPLQALRATLGFLSVINARVLRQGGSSLLTWIGLAGWLFIVAVVLFGVLLVLVSLVVQGCSSAVRDSVAALLFVVITSLVGYGLGRAGREAEETFERVEREQLDSLDEDSGSSPRK